MPTSRAYTFLGAALTLYFFANQTQVGWLYVMSALLVGVVAASYWLSRGALKGITASRRVGQSVNGELVEGDEVAIDLTLQSRSGASQLRVIETCPLAAPEDRFRASTIFIPSLAAGAAVQFDYTVTVDRRGLHEFPSLALASRAPFGFFQRQDVLSVPTRVLVYPELKRLNRLDLLDRRLAPEVTHPRAGVGSEVLGIRAFRSGDSPRHIHWRSMARTGQLMSKEFADEVQPGVTLALDLYKHPYPSSITKHVPFEWAIKLAASIGDYAQRKGYGVHLATDQEVLAAPGGALSWEALLQYLARVQPEGKLPFADILAQPSQAFVAALLPWPDLSVIQPLVELRHRRVELLALVLDPQTFPAGGPSAAPLADALLAAGITTRLISFSKDWTAALNEQPVMEGQR